MKTLHRYTTPRAVTASIALTSFATIAAGVLLGFAAYFALSSLL